MSLMSDPAIEAAQRLRSLHTPIRISENYAYCDECDTAWPCATARSVYTTEELNRV